MKRQLVLGVVDLAAVEGHAGAVLLGLPEHVEGVEGRACRAAEDAHHQRAVVAGQGLHGGRAVVDDLQEQRPARGWSPPPACARCGR